MKRNKLFSSFIICLFLCLFSEGRASEKVDVCVPSKLGNSQVVSLITGIITEQDKISLLVDPNSELVDILKFGNFYNDLSIEVLMWKYFNSQSMMSNIARARDYKMFEEMYSLVNIKPGLPTIKPVFDEIFRTYIIGLKDNKKDKEIAILVASKLKNKMFAVGELPHFMSYNYKRYFGTIATPLVQTMGRILYGSHQLLEKHSYISFHIAGI